MENIISYSQENEDIILYHILKNENPIFWIDVGANDSEFLSVTKIFYDNGASGINIEPQRMYMDKYTKERERDVTLCIGLSDKAGTLMLHGTGTGASFEMSGGVNSESVNVYTLETICDKYIKEKTIHFLKIDVEGFERNVLLGANFLKYRPIVILIESTIPNTEIPHFSQWEEILLSNHYSFQFQVGINRIYLANERLDLQERCLQAPDVENMYNIFHASDYLEKINKLENELASYKSTVHDIYGSKTYKILGKIRSILNIK